MDEKLFSWIHRWAEKNNALDSFMIFLSSYPIYVMIVVIIGLLFFRSTRFWGIVGCASILFGLLLNTIIAKLFFRERPFVQHQFTPLMEKDPTSASFPSDQATIAFTFAWTIFMINRKWGSLCFLLAVLIGFSRIFVGHHYPTDLFGGFAIASIVAWISYFGLKQWKR